MEMVARIPAGTSPLTAAGPPPGSPTGSTVTFRKEIKSPLWHPPDGNISMHVMVLNRQRRDTNVDHCHRTGKVRGLLCNCCNTRLGRMEVDPLLTQASLSYAGVIS